MDRTLVAQAKSGSHWIAWAPGQTAEKCTFLRTTAGKYVWVRLSSGQECRLNETCSQLLLEGKYRR